MARVPTGTTFSVATAFSAPVVVSGVSNAVEGVVMEPRKAPVNLLLLCSITTIAVAVAVAVATYFSLASRTVKAGTSYATPKIPVSSNITVYHAASLNNIMALWINPGYTSKYNIGVKTVSDTSGNLAKQLKKGEVADVFISADGKISAALIKAKLPNSTEPVVEWYTYWASTRLGIAYNTKSRFAAELSSIVTDNVPWYKVLNHVTMNLGRTDPDTDPKGKVTSSFLIFYLFPLLYYT